MHVPLFVYNLASLVCQQPTAVAYYLSSTRKRRLSLLLLLLLLSLLGIVFSSGEGAAAAAMRNAVKIEKLEDPVLPVSEILKRVPQKQLLEVYKIGTFDGVDQFLQLIANARGKLKKGGIVDTEVRRSANHFQFSPYVLNLLSVSLETYNTTQHNTIQCTTLQHIVCITIYFLCKDANPDGSGTEHGRGRTHCIRPRVGICHEQIKVVGRSANLRSPQAIRWSQMGRPAHDIQQQHATRIGS